MRTDVRKDIQEAYNQYSLPRFISKLTSTMLHTVYGHIHVRIRHPLYLRRIHTSITAYVSPKATIDSRGGTIRIGYRSIVRRYAMLLTKGGNITIGKHSTINPFSILYGNGNLVIGDDVMISAHTLMVPANHRFDHPATPIRHQGETHEGIIIEDDVWVGANCTILDGVTIGRGSVIGAGRVVTKDIPPYSVAVGNPAKVMRERNTGISRYSSV